MFTSKYQVPRKCCASHVNADKHGGIAPDAPDRTTEYELLGHIRILVDEEQGYQRLLGHLLELPYDDLYGFVAPLFVWIRIVQ